MKNSEQREHVRQKKRVQRVTKKFLEVSRCSRAKQSRFPLIN